MVVFIDDEGRHHGFAYYEPRNKEFQLSYDAYDPEENDYNQRLFKISEQDVEENFKKLMDSYHKEDNVYLLVDLRKKGGLITVRATITEKHFNYVEYLDMTCLELEDPQCKSENVKIIQFNSLYNEKKVELY